MRSSSLAILLAILALPPTASAQVPRQGDPTSACDDCCVQLRHIARLGDAEGAGYLPDLPTDVSWKEPDGFLVSTQAWSSPVQVFARDGRFIRTIGQGGEGPGEYRTPTESALLPGDSVLLVDPGLGRVSVLAPDLRFARSYRLPAGGFMGLVVRWPHAILNQSIRTPGRIGYPLHLAEFTDGELRITHSFGSDGTLLAGGARALIRRFFTLEDASLWSTPAYQLSLELRSFDGQLLRSFSHAPAWLQSANPSHDFGNHTTPPSPSIQAIAATERLVWVFARVPAEGWQGAWEHIDPARSEVRVSEIELPLLFESHIAVFDGETGARVHEEPWTELVSGVIDEDHLYTLERDVLGVNRISIWAYSLESEDACER